MKRNWTHLGTSFLTLLLAGSALALQKDPDEDVPDNAEHYSWFQQPWTPPASSFRSRVFSCQNPVPLNVAAFDDFHSEEDGFAVRVRWWGTLSAAAQAQRPFYIAIYDDSNCRPDTLLYADCVVPQAQFLQMDCSGRLVYRFRANIQPFPVVAGQRYWLQISENDTQSLQQGVDDFAWSGRQPVRGCPAVQCNGDHVCQNLLDPCNNQLSDLSFGVLFFVP